MNKIFENSFYNLLVIYIILVVLISLNLFWKYTLHFEIFALILGILGITLVLNIDKIEILKTLKDKINPSRKFMYLIMGIAVVLIFLFRVIPYFNNSIPLGYDAGIYKFGIESFAEKVFGVDSWVKSALSPGFLYFFSALYKLGVSINFILIWLFIGFNVLLGISIYLFSKEYFNKKAGIISLVLYAVSVIQFKVFAFMYYKNIIALSALLLALVFLKKEKRHLFMLFGVIVGIMHQPTFLIFGLAYMAFTIKNYKSWKKNVISGIIILIITGIFYIGFYKEAILPLIYPVANSLISPGESPGTFLSFFTYQFLTLAYLPFAIIGLAYLTKKKQFNVLFFLAVITALIVYFQFFFFNRFIIHLDVALIILAGAGFWILIENKRIFGTVILTLMVLSAGFVTYHEAINTKPLISDAGLKLIQKLQTTEENSSVMVISKEYSPWVLAYSKRKTIAPGLFDENKWDEEEWQKFWSVTGEQETREMLLIYHKPLYLFAGTKKFNNTCFSVYLEDSGEKIYKYEC